MTWPQENPSGGGDCDGDGDQRQEVRTENLREWPESPAS